MNTSSSTGYTVWFDFSASTTAAPTERYDKSTLVGYGVPQVQPQLFAARFGNAVVVTPVVASPSHEISDRHNDRRAATGGLLD